MSLYLASSSYRRTLVLPCSLFLMSLPLSGGFVKLILFIYFIFKMSVRNILDGTIPVGGGIGPGILDEVKTNSLTVGTSGMLCTGPMTCASTATVDKVNAITGITTPSLNIEGTKVASPSLTLGGTQNDQVLPQPYNECTSQGTEGRWSYSS